MKLLIIAITIFLTGTLNGQNDTSRLKPIHKIGFDLGGAHYQVRDDVIAPLRWNGLGCDIALSYSLIGDKGLHDIKLRIPVAFLSNRYDHKSKAGEIYLGYGYMHRISGRESHAKIYLGGLMDWNFNLQYYDNWDDSHFYWLNVYELGPVAQLNYALKDKNQVTLRFNFSLIALASRPPEYRYYDQFKLSKIYSEPHENMVLTSIHEYISIGLRGHYMSQMNEKIAMGVSYFVSYKTYSKPERISLFTNTLLLNFRFTLGNIKKDIHE